ncbi:hypothetical protein L1049_002263 [Liquidambar formosana]|uniref:Uncharacterized protein n=1 Tax=Liquidambar formosana TaxID=63359 RepID=A0AAP0NFP1_LIQFO
MEAISLRSSILRPPSFSTVRTQCPKMGLQQSRKRRSSGGRVFAAGGDSYEWDHYSGRLVNESKIILRKRIHGMKMVERNHEPPAEWMEWERRYYTCYDDGVCKAVGLLQS